MGTEELTHFHRQNTHYMRPKAHANKGNCSRLRRKLYDRLLEWKAANKREPPLSSWPWTVMTTWLRLDPNWAFTTGAMTTPRR